MNIEIFEHISNRILADTHSQALIGDNLYQTTKELLVNKYLTNGLGAVFYDFTNAPIDQDRETFNVKFNIYLKTIKQCAEYSHLLDEMINFPYGALPRTTYTRFPTVTAHVAKVKKYSSEPRYDSGTNHQRLTLRYEYTIVIL